MKKLPLLLLLITALALVACGGSDPTPTPVPPTAVPPTEAPPTTEPEAAATEAPGSYVDTLTHVPDVSLVNITWHWVRRDPNGNDSAEIVVPNPENYALLFNEDGTFSSQVDCNQMSGRYATEAPGSIFMEAGAMTMAMCAEDSFSNDMLQMFGPAQNYRFEENGNTLVFSWVAGGPEDYFQNVVAAAEETPGSMIDEMEHVPDPELIDKTWAWERRDANGNDIPAITISNAENYTLFFNEDGTFNAKVDCNQMNGRYATDAPGSIFMEGGAMTMAFCGENSYDQAMLQMFGPAQDYRFEEEGNVLVFPWVAGGPVDYYRLVPTVEIPEPANEDAATGTVTAPDGVFLRTGPGANYPTVGAVPEGTTGEIIGVSADGQWWVANAPNLPGGQVWVSAEWVEATNAENVPVITAPSIQLSLTGTPWQWVSTTDPAGVTAVNDPTRYMVLFNDDGTVNIQADCNSVLGTYSTTAADVTVISGADISITLGPSTMVACPEDSQADQFLAQLSSAAIYFIQNDNLYLDLPADSGTMRFVPQGTPPPAPDAPTAEADGRTFYLQSFGPADAPQPILEGTEITAHFANDTISGNAGCNNYSGTVTPVDDYFQVTGILTTLMLCAEDVMAQEQAYLAGLAALAGYQWEQTLTDEDALATNAQLFYTLPDGTAGVMNFVATP